MSSLETVVTAVYVEEWPEIAVNFSLNMWSNLSSNLENYCMGQHKGYRKCSSSSINLWWSRKEVQKQYLVLKWKKGNV